MPKKENKATLPDIIMDLPVKLSLEELAERASKMGEYEAKATEADERAKAAKADQKYAESQRAVMGEVLRNRQEIRAVRCSQSPDYTASAVTVRRMDTGEIVRVRELSQHERQQELPLPDTRAILTAAADAFNATEAEKAKREGREPEAHATVLPKA